MNKAFVYDDNSYSDKISAQAALNKNFKIGDLVMLDMSPYPPAGNSTNLCIYLGAGCIPMLAAYLHTTWGLASIILLPSVKITKIG